MIFNEQISKHINKLNDTDKKILDFFLTHSSMVQQMKLKDITSELFLSPNSVIRFAQKIGYTGFSQMKYDIVHNSNLKYGSTDNPLSFTDSGERIISGIQKTIDINREIYLNQATDLLYNSKNIVFFALGLSKNSTKSFSQRLQVLNKVCIISDDRDNAITLAKNIDNSFVAFFVSLSGNSEIMIQCSNYLKEKDVTILSLTGLDQNYLQEISDISLYAHSDFLKIDKTDVSSRLYIEFVLEILITKLYGMRDEQLNQEN